MDGLNTLPNLLQDLESRATTPSPSASKLPKHLSTGEIAAICVVVGLFTALVLGLFVSAICGGIKDVQRRRAVWNRMLENMRIRQRAQGSGLPHEDREGDIELAKVRQRAEGSGNPFWDPEPEAEAEPEQEQEQELAREVVAEGDRAHDFAYPAGHANQPRTKGPGHPDGETAGYRAQK